MEYVSGNPANHDNEVSEAKFFPIQEALVGLTYNNDRLILQKALGLFD